MKEKYIYVKNQKIQVLRSLYLEFDRLRSQQKYSDNKYRCHTVHVDTIVNDTDIEETAIRNVLKQQMISILKQLDDKDIRLIHELFFNWKSERQLASEWGIPRMTLHNRKKQVLEQIRKMMGF